MLRVMFVDLCIGSARSSLWARRGHAMSVQLHEQSPQKGGHSKIHGHHTPTDTARRHSATI